MKILICYIAVINLITFFTFAVDKRKARKNKWRISEATLMFLCLIGGALGGWCSMYMVHHKTQKPLFKYGVPTALILQILILTYFV